MLTIVKICIFLPEAYRVRTLNPTLCKLFRKKCVKKQCINIVIPNLQTMFVWIYYIRLFEKIAASLHHSLNPRAEPLGGLGHGDLGRLPITSVIFAIREARVLWGA